MPGLINNEGIIKIAPNLPGWIDINLKEILSKVFPIPITVDNDANTAAFAELMLGAGKNEDNFIYITLGTGIGGSIIINRKIYRGQYGGAGEIGHLIIDANQRLNHEKPYRTGVLEEYIGRKQITKLGQLIMNKYPNSILHQYMKPDPYFISEAVKKGDEAAIEIFHHIGRYIGIGLASTINLLNISLVIIGGGISQAHPLLFDTALKVIRQRALPYIANLVELRKAAFTKDSGIIGAALMGKMTK